MTGDAWRQELARRDSLGTPDELTEMVAALPWAQREELRAWLLQHMTPPGVEDATGREAARREIDAALPWIRTEALPYLVRMARALAERR